MKNLIHKKNKFKKGAYSEKYEKDFILFGLFSFIILSVISFVFFLPLLFGLYSQIYPKNENKVNEKKYIQKSQIPADTNYKSGIALFDEKNYSLALESFEKALIEEPDNIGYLTEYALTSYRLKNYKDALKSYQKIIDIDKNSVSSYNSIGNIYWITKDYDLAEKNYQKAIEIDPSLISAYNNYALMLDEEGKTETAKEILLQGMEANSENTELKVTLRIIE